MLYKHLASHPGSLKEDSMNEARKAMYHKTVWRRDEERRKTLVCENHHLYIYYDEYGKVQINSKNGAQAPTLSVHWNLIEGVVQRLTSKHCGYIYNYVGNK